jgi:beta-phosphoglucomutase-like phosphatase (HAD superfamily)
MRRIDAVIFDLDGLIIDSETPEVMAWTAVYARYGMEFPVASWLQNVGRNDRLWDPLGPFRAPGSPAPPDTVAAIWREQADAAMAGYFTPLPGVVPLLTALRQRGVRTAVASSSRRAWIQKVLARLGLEDQFDAAAACEARARRLPPCRAPPRDGAGDLRGARGQPKRRALGQGGRDGLHRGPVAADQATGFF